MKAGWEMMAKARTTIMDRLPAILTALILFVAPQAFAADQSLTVFAAASLKETMSKIADDWKAETGREVKLSFAASSALAKQIDEGAPADLFISADLNWMDHLDKGGELVPGSRVNLLGNRIVLVAASSSTITTKIAPGFDLAGLLGDERLAMGNVASVPAGVYGKAALENLGVWANIKDKVAQADNVRAALLLVSRQEAPLGIVYETDARVDPAVKILDRFPENSHPAIVYPAGVLKASTNPDAKAFLAYLQQGKASKVFRTAGFTVLTKIN
ncbi:molybdate ABC transporter substrate-binding protein [Agrobacterium vitis]|uniref:molybdate ABC transporter substrate-binding protein n=1 Tax=Agrobacterium vitis TaxID=373 RepID=UPI0009BDC392|nr:molybdate ABC transporter substrate-binding protein [Agrobacterium vitis]MCE6074877.1 molybdate ABC transporter substrate-binding protein [Agrobacterium vitis]MCF1467448.1 molybdate ABC transporter substrate-binding protein [Agrobacterium vitis]MCM2467718.1 molybdate ABC transporter substrate-binding protein [Agrobacterium vitis]MUO68377.1 molybdate ABC transporter substrate-binding protein [Agrobacterium vitis]MUO83405.1 molybdate ABC transporter substrate-binding protein [Agrobacterium vi